MRLSGLIGPFAFEANTTSGQPALLERNASTDRGFSGNAVYRSEDQLRSHDICRAPDCAFLRIQTLHIEINHFAYLDLLKTLRHAVHVVFRRVSHPRLCAPQISSRRFQADLSSQALRTAEIISSFSGVSLIPGSAHRRYHLIDHSGTVSCLCYSRG